MEDPGTYTVATPEYSERMQSQLPALDLLIRLGWEYLPPTRANELRAGRLGNVILEDVLRQSIRDRCRYEFKGRTHPFTENAIHAAVERLKGFRATALYQNADVYDLLCLGASEPQTVDGDTKSFTIAYVDWASPENNTYHCTAEFRVERPGQDAHYVPDIVLFVNGIPLAVLECKRSAYLNFRKNPLDLAITQMAGYQAKNGIPQLFLYTQLLLAVARTEALYGTSGTPRKFWSAWQEDGVEDGVTALLAKPTPESVRDHVLADDGPFSSCREEFLELTDEERGVTEQDRTLYGLCRPERLLELVYGFVIYDQGRKKIARYQQYFTVGNILERVHTCRADGTRPGGVVWHTQGSGKSLTMVMLAKALALAPDILNPKVVLVTDRIDLDDQICGTFRACGLEPEQAATGANLVDLLLDERTHVVTTLVHKFASAVANRGLPQASANTFVLIDEGHRSHYQSHHANMKLALKGACFIAFTGTPLARSARRNTFAQFGDLFRPAYPIEQAVRDKAIVPLLYEARHVPQSVDRAAIDSWFERMTAGLTKEQRADLKRKFATEDHLNRALQKIRLVAWDIGVHFSTHLQGTGLKGQLIAPGKLTALKYKDCLDEFGLVSSEVLISAPGEIEGEDGPGDDNVRITEFWERMMDRFGTEEAYNRQLINAFKHGEEPGIIIVVDKLTTGFDAPRNAVLYLTRKLRQHTLLQAIARVNRLCDGKDHGLILDYRGVIEELDEAIDFYAQLADYDPADLRRTVTNIGEEVSKLPQRHSDVWELFAGLKGSRDQDAYEKRMDDPNDRRRFYDRLRVFSQTLSLALSSSDFLETASAQQIDRYREDFKLFQNLRASLGRRHQEVVSYAEYEPRIQKLIDTHVGASEVEKLCDPINLLDANERRAVLEDQGLSLASRADTIAAATSRAIEEQMDRDPAFYRKFSKLLEDTIRAHREGRIRDLEYFQRSEEIAERVATHTDDDTPELLRGQDMAQRYFGCVHESLGEYIVNGRDIEAETALQVERCIEKQKVRDWRGNPDAINAMRNEIDDILFELGEKHGVEFDLDDLDAIIDRCIEVAIANEE